VRLHWPEKKAVFFHVLKDTGSNRNYIQPKLIPNPIQNINPFQAASVAGNIKTITTWQTYSTTQIL